MDEGKLKSLIKSEISNAIGYFTEDGISAERRESLSFYKGDPFGNEVDGRSKVVLRDVADTIEAALPGLIKVFAAGEYVAEFEPVGPEDEEVAEQATDYVNYIFMNDNPGFSILHTWFKDSLISKVAAVKTWWDESKTVRTRTYTGLSEEKFIELTAPDEVEVLEHTKEEKTEQIRDPMTGELLSIPVVSHSVKVKRTETVGRVKVDPLPPEEFLVSRRAKSLEDADFVAHRTRQTKEELIARGFDRSEVEHIPMSNDMDGNADREERFDDQEDGWGDTEDDRITVYECYIRVDEDDDGIAELRRVTVAGDNAYHILENEEVDLLPFAVLCPIPMPHKLFGMGLADLVKDVQLVKSTLMRQMLDNLYLSNYPQREVVTGQLDKGAWDNILNVKPGGPIPVKVAGAVRDLAVPFTAAASFPMLEYWDSIKSTRSGVEPMMGMDAEVLQNQSATAANLGNAARVERLELVARIFAETGIRDLFGKILKLVVMNQDRARVIRLRNKWVDMDPTNWNPEMDVRVNVGLGFASSSEKMAALSFILAQQKEAMAAGLPFVQPKHLFNSAKEVVKASGLKHVESYFMDPGDAPVQQGEDKPDPALLKLQQEAEIKQAEMQQQANIKMAELEQEAEIKREQIAAEMQMKREQFAAEMQMKREQMAIEARFKLNQPEVRFGGDPG